MLHILVVDRVYCSPGNFLFFQEQVNLQTSLHRLSLRRQTAPLEEDGNAHRSSGYYDESIFFSVSFSHPLTEVLATFVPMTRSEPGFWLPALPQRPPIDAFWLLQREDEDETEETYESSAAFHSLFLLDELSNLYQRRPFPFAFQLLRPDFRCGPRVEPPLSREERPSINAAALESDIRAFFPPDFPFRLFPFHSALRDLKNRDGQAFMNSIFLWLLSHANPRR